MSEAALIPYAVEWCRRRGLVAMLEVPLPCTSGVRPVDICAWDSRRIVAIEAKVRMNGKAVDQAESCQGADERWVLCEAASMSLVESAGERGIGTLIPGDDGSCVELVPTTINFPPPELTHEWRERLSRAATKTEAGVPQRKGVSGYAVEEASIRAYLAEHGPTSWRVLARRVDHSAGRWINFRQRHAHAIGWKPERNYE